MLVQAHVFSPGLRSMHFAPVEQPRPVDGACLRVTDTALAVLLSSDTKMLLLRDVCGTGALMGAVSEAYPLRRKWRSVATQGASLLVPPPPKKTEVFVHFQMAFMCSSTFLD